MSVACIRRIRSTDPETRQTPIGAIRLFELLLGAELVGVTALLLALWDMLAYIRDTEKSRPSGWYQ